LSEGDGTRTRHHRDERLALALRQALDGLQNAAAVRGEAGGAARRGGHRLVAQLHGGRLFI
jgi:hypothetical protein